MSEKLTQIPDDELAAIIVDLIRNPRVSREDGINLVVQAMKAARSGGEADATRSAWDSSLRTFDKVMEAAAHKSVGTVAR